MAIISLVDPVLTPLIQADTFDGYIDAVRVYNYPVSQKQIVSDLNAGHPAPGSPIGTPIAWWKFNEGFGTTANSSGSQVSVLAGTMSNFSSPATSTSGWTQSGKFGKALIFDGTTGSCTGRCDDSINAGSDPSIDDLTSSSMSLSAWIYPNTMGESSQGVIMAKNSGATLSSGWLWQMAGTNALKFSVDGTTDLVRTTSNNALTMGAWNYVTLTWNGTFTDATTVHMYVNGLETSYQTTTNGSARVSDAASSLFIGNDSSGASTFDGKIDEVKVYNLQLTADQVKIDMNYGQTQQIGALSASSSSTDPNSAASQEYCVPGDSTSCAGPVGRWDFEEGTGGSGATTRDTSGNSYDGTLSVGSPPTWTSGKIGKSLNYVSTSCQKVTTADITQIDNVSQMTAEAWVKRATTSSAVDVAKLDSGANNGFYLEINTGGTANFGLDNAGDTFGSVTLNDTNWHHLVLVFDGSKSGNANRLKGYVDGIQQSLSFTGTIPSTTSNTTDQVVFGSPGNFAGTCTDGKIDHVLIYNYARSAAQVEWDYNHGGPVAWWKLDDCTGTTIHDSAGNSNSLTQSGSTSGSCSTASTFWGGSGGTGAGKRNYAPTFTASNNDVAQETETTSTDLGATTDSYSLAAWIKTSTTFSTSGYIIAKDDGSGAYPYKLYIDTSQHGCFQISDGTHSPSVCGSVALNDGNWHHLVGVRDVPNTKLHLYVDGVKAATDVTDSTTATAANNDNVTIGNGGTSYTAQDFDGQIDDARIYNYPLTLYQATQIMNNGGATFAPATGTP